MRRFLALFRFEFSTLLVIQIRWKIRKFSGWTNIDAGKSFLLLFYKSKPKTPFVNVWISIWIVCIRSIFMLMRIVFSMFSNQKFMGKIWSHWTIASIFDWPYCHCLCEWIFTTKEFVASLILLIFQYTKHITASDSRFKWCRWIKSHILHNFTHEHKHYKRLFSNPLHFFILAYLLTPVIWMSYIRIDLVKWNRKRSGFGHDRKLNVLFNQMRDCQGISYVGFLYI